MTNPTYTANYTYGNDGLRLRVQESNNPNPDRWMQYDGVRLVAEGTLDGDTFTTVNPYVWEGDDYYSPLIHADFADQTRYFLYDGLGSTRQLLDSDEDVTDTYVYEAFGNVLSDGGPTPNPYRYVGSLGYYQTGSSLMHLGARYYMPAIGRFVQPDPAPLQPFEAYAYCTDSPTMAVDPSGQVTIDASCDPWGGQTTRALAEARRRVYHNNECRKAFNVVCDNDLSPLDAGTEPKVTCDPNCQAMGYYDPAKPGQVTVVPPNNPNFNELVLTIIHELAHWCYDNKHRLPPIPDPPGHGEGYWIEKHCRR